MMSNCIHLVEFHSIVFLPSMITYNFLLVVEQLYGGVSINIWKLVLFASVVIFLVLKFCRQPFINYINAENEKLE
jgi:hypothetical protein